MTTTTSPEKTSELLRNVLSDLATVVAGVTAEQEHDPTPCAEYDVSQLRDHILGWLTTFADGFADPDGRAPRTDLEGYRSPTDPAGAVRAAADRMGRAVRDGAAARPLWIGEYSMPGDMALGMSLGEYVVHGWDLARATGQPWAPPAEAVEVSLGLMAGMLGPDEQGPGKSFAAPVDVPADAPILDRLLGCTGRDPGWQAD